MLRRKALIESPRWAAVRGRQDHLDDAVARLHGTGPGEQKTGSVTGATYRWLHEIGAALRRSGVRRGLAFIVPVYVMAGIIDGTGGQFTPYLLHQYGNKSASVSLFLTFMGFGIGVILTIVYTVARLGDRVNRRGLYAGTQLTTSIGFWLLVFVSFTIPVVPCIYVAITQFNSLRRWPLDRVWLVELYPTEVRGSLQAAVWGTMRLVLGVWSLFVADILAGAGVRTLALIMGILALLVALIGGTFGPRTQGESLELIQEQRDRPRRPRPAPGAGSPVTH